MQSFYLCFMEKVYKKLCVRPHDTYFLFKTFFSLVNNKSYLFVIGQYPSIFYQAQFKFKCQ